MHTSILLLLIGNSLTGRINEINLPNVLPWAETSRGSLDSSKKANPTLEPGCQACTNWPGLILQALAWSPPVDPLIQTKRADSGSLPSQHSP